MKKIITPGFSDIFPLRKHSDRSLSPFWYQTKFFNLTSVFLMASALMLFLGLMGVRNLLLGGLVLGGYCAYCFVRNYLLAHQLNLKRTIPTEGVEREEVTISYELVNRAQMAIPNLKVEDTHNLSLRGVISFSIGNFASKQKRIFRSQVLLDNGMGVKSFSTVIATITDALDLFPIKILFEMKLKDVQVHPRVDESLWAPKSGNPHSFHHGPYHESFSGEGVEFLGVREYRSGDPIKKLNWKQIAKRDELVVNEFEKMTNASITIYIERNVRVHFGLGAQSTWELARDVALGLASHNLQAMNNICLIARDYYSGEGQGSNFLKKLEYELANLEPVIPTPQNSCETQLFELGHHPGKVLLWISPLVNMAEVEKGLIWLERLAQKGHRGLFVALVGVMKVATELDPQLIPYLKSLGEREKEARKTLSQRLKAQGIGYSEVTFDFRGGPLTEEYEL